MLKNRDLTPRNLKKLAQRAAACPGWRWMPGMLVEWDPSTRPGGCMMETTRARIVEGFAHCAVTTLPEGRNARPRLDDPATLGWLLALVREALADPELFARREIGGSGWVVIRSNSVRPICGATEAEALVAALEAAP